MMMGRSMFAGAGRLAAGAFVLLGALTFAAPNEASAQFSFGFGRQRAMMPNRAVMPNRGMMMRSPMARPPMMARPSMMARPVNRYPGMMTRGPSRYPGMATRYPGAGTRYPGMTTRYPGAATRYPGAATRYPGVATRYPGVGTRYPGVGTRYPGAGTRNPGAGTRYPGVGTRTPGVGTRNPGSATRIPGRVPGGSTACAYGGRGCTRPPPATGCRGRSCPGTGTGPVAGCRGRNCPGTTTPTPGCRGRECPTTPPVTGCRGRNCPTNPPPVVGCRGRNCGDYPPPIAGCRGRNCGDYPPPVTVPPRPPHRPPVIVDRSPPIVVPPQPPVAIITPVVPVRPPVVLGPPARRPPLPPSVIASLPPSRWTPPPALPRLAPVTIPPASENRFVPNEVLVTFRGRPSQQIVQTFAQTNRLTLLSAESFQLSQLTLHRFRIVDGRDVRTVLRAIARDQRVANAQPNFVFELVQDQGGSASSAPPPPPASILAPGGAPPPPPPQDESLRDMQYAPDRLRVTDAHRFARGERIVIAVIDSGVDVDHPELTGVVRESINATDGPATADCHGTAMAGAIAARSRLAGIAPGAEIVAIRAFEGAQVCGRGTTNSFYLQRAFDHAVASGARIINMSFAGPRDPNVARALEGARARGVVLIAASGNNGARAAPQFPAAEPTVIAVIATDIQDRLYQDAVRGRHIAVAAPGVDVYVPAPGGGYDTSTGTSVAAAHVSGVVALLLQRNELLDGDTVRRILTATARALAGVGPEAGAGLVDALAAISVVPPSTTRPSAALN